MTSENRLVGRVERSLALAPVWQVGHSTQRQRLERVDLAGAIAAVERGKLGELEFDVLAWLGEQWWEQGASPDGVVRFTWYGLGRDLWGAKPSGTHRRLAREAIGNLMGAVVTLSGIDIHTGELTPSLFSDVHILRSVVRGRRRGESGNAVVDGGQREETAEVRLEDWIVAQLLGDVSFVLNWQIQRELTGVAKRLWSYLAAREQDFDATSWPGSGGWTYVWMSVRSSRWGSRRSMRATHGCVSGAPESASSTPTLGSYESRLSASTSARTATSCAPCDVWTL